MSFNIDYDRKFYSVEGFVNRFLHLRVTYYTFEESLLAGFFSTAREGLLDLYFVRLNPLESALTILPAFWWILAGAACAFGTAFYLCGENKSELRFWSARMFSVQMPAMCLAVLGVMKIGDPGESGLRLKISNSQNASYKTIVQDISIDKLLNGREVYTLASPFQMRWSGDIYCPKPGIYSFQADSSRPLKFSMANQEKRTGPGISTLDIVVLDQGWQTLKIYCYETATTDHFFVRCKFPDQPDYKPISDYKLKH